MRIGCSGVNIRKRGKEGKNEEVECYGWVWNGGGWGGGLWANTRVRRICTIEGERRWGNKVIPAALSRSGVRRVAVKENTKGDK